MNEIKCPNCGTVFQINEEDYDSIVKQVRDKEFEREINLRDEQAKIDKENAVKIAESKKDIEITNLKNEIKNIGESTKNDLEKKFNEELRRKELEINNLFKLDENAQAKKITKTVQALVNKFRFMSTEYNKQGVHTHCQPSDCVIITTPDQLANLNVELLATAFNVPYAEMPSRIVVIDSFINKDKTDDNDTVCIVADMDLVQFRNTLDTWETFRNPDGLMTNMFHHVWGSACGCGFVNAVKIKNKTS